MPLRRSRRPVGLLFRLLTIGLLLSGCGSTAPTTPAATIAAVSLPADWQRVDLRQVSLALPPDWMTTTPDNLDVGSVVDQMASQNPQLKAALDRGRVALGSGQVQLIAYDLAPTDMDQTGFPPNLQIGRQQYSEAPDLANVAAVNEEDLRKTTGVSDVQRTPVSLAGKPSTRLTSKLQLNDVSGQPLKLAVEQYLLVEGNTVFVISITAPEARPASYRKTLDQILGTLRFTPTR